MREIERYFRGDEYRQIKEKLERLNSTLKEIAKLFKGSFLEQMKRWEYVWPHGTEEEGKYSYSTQAMCLVGVGELIKYPSWMEDDGLQLQKDLKKHWIECGKKLIEELVKNSESGELLFKSSTYGEKDVLTASWIIEYLLDNKKEIVEMPTHKSFNFDYLIGKIINIIYEKFDDGLHETSTKKGVVIDPKNNQAGPHAFPLYLSVSALSTLINVKDEKNGENGKYIDNLYSKGHCKYDNTRIEEIIGLTGDYFLERLSEQLSLCHLNKFRFDAAELSFCLAGLVITKKIDIKNQLIDKILDIIREAQEKSECWRPCQPVIADKQGMVLIPISIEVANALLKVVTGNKSDNNRFNKQNLTMFSKYYDWLESQKIQPSDRERHWGWPSEHASHTEIIHLWMTSQVAYFMVRYHEQLESYLQRQVLLKSKLSCKKPKALKTKLADMEYTQLMKVIESDFIVHHTNHENRKAGKRKLASDGKFSMLLYGPPGTSKTTIVEALANELGCTLITITPSDFLAGGQEGIEQAAKTIFNVLKKLKDCVILFDEIDRLILDRDAKAYGNQSDIFQCMTPGMLTKFNDLREKGQNIFIISTNYKERIDPAIIRPGRIDEKYLVLPFDKESRKNLLIDFVKKEWGRNKWPSSDEPEIDNIVAATPLWVYQELKKLVTSSAKKVHEDKTILKDDKIKKMIENMEDKADIEVPGISIKSYKNRFKVNGKCDYNDEPFEEYFHLCSLLHEVGKLKDDEQKVMKTLLDNWTEEKQRTNKLSEKKLVKKMISDVCKKKETD